MDLGTANTIITTNGKIVVDEPSVVALDRRTDKMIAVGDKAKMMHEKTHENIRTIRPLRDGVIARLSVFCADPPERTPSPSPGEGRGGVGFVNDAADGNGRIQERLAEDFTHAAGLL